MACHSFWWVAHSFFSLFLFVVVESVRGKDSTHEAVFLTLSPYSLSLSHTHPHPHPHPPTHFLVHITAKQAERSSAGAAFSVRGIPALIVVNSSGEVCFFTFPPRALSLSLLSARARVIRERASDDRACVCDM